MRGGTSAAAAEDLAQEAMLTVWRKATLFDPAKASAATWIFTIARNLRIDALRRERRPGISIPTIPPCCRKASAAPMPFWRRARTRQALSHALRDLPHGQSEIDAIFLPGQAAQPDRRRDGDIPLGTVKSRLRLAMARLRLALGDLA